MEWIFSKLDSGFQSLVGFRILSAGFRIPKPRIPDSTSKKFLDSGIRIPLHGATRILVKRHPGKLNFTFFFTIKVNTVIFIEGGFIILRSGEGLIAK